MRRSTATRLAGSLAQAGDTRTRLKAALTRRHFAESARSWDLWHELCHGRTPSEAGPRWLRTLVARESARLRPWLTPRSTFLDLGCGTGRTLRLVAPHCRRAHGLDISPRALLYAARACRGLENVVLHRVSSWRLPLGNERLDLVYSLETLQYLDIESVIAYLQECRRVMKPQGRLLCTLPNLLAGPNIRYILDPARSNWPGPDRFRFWTAEMVRRLFPGCGLRIERLSPGRFLEIRARRA